MVERYSQLYGELKLLENQLKNKCKVKFGKKISTRILSSRKSLVDPAMFIKLLGVRNEK